MDNKGQSLVETGIGILVAVIVIGAVAIPVITDVISEVDLANYSMTENILGYVPLALGLGLFVASISIVR